MGNFVLTGTKICKFWRLPQTSTTGLGLSLQFWNNHWPVRLYSLPSDSPGFTDSFQLEPVVKACVNITCRSSSTLKSLRILQVWDLFPVWDLHYRFLKVLQVFSGAEATWEISYLPVIKFVSSKDFHRHLPQVWDFHCSFEICAKGSQDFTGIFRVRINTTSLNRLHQRMQVYIIET